MQFCLPHWERLRHEVMEVQGLRDLVSKGGEKAMAQLVSEIENGRTAANFDPLMAAHWAIIHRIAEAAPSVVLIPGCPLCWVQDEHERSCRTPGCTITRQTFEDWIPSVAEFMRQEWERLRQEGL